MNSRAVTAEADALQLLPKTAVDGEDDHDEEEEYDMDSI